MLLSAKTWRPLVLGGVILLLALATCVVSVRLLAPSLALIEEAGALVELLSVVLLCMCWGAVAHRLLHVGSDDLRPDRQSLARWLLLIALPVLAGGAAATLIIGLFQPNRVFFTPMTWWLPRLGVVGMCWTMGATASAIVTATRHRWAMADQEHALHTPARQHRRVRLLGASVLALLGLLADCYAGLLTLSGALTPGLLLHIPASLAWVLGVALYHDVHLNALPAHTVALWLRVSGRSVEQVQPGADAHLSGWVVAAALLGLGLFPGLGPLGGSVAFLLAALLHRSARHRDRRDAGEQPRHSTSASHDEHVEPLVALEIQPLVDILKGGQIDLRLAAIDVLGRQATRDTIRLLRGLLLDPEADIRSAAAVTLTRVEYEMSRDLKRLMTLVAQDPSVPERHADLGQAYYRYATSHLLDEVSGQFYLNQSRDAYQRAIDLAPTRANLWLRLAQIQSDLGNGDAAHSAMQTALELDPAQDDAYLLGMELAINAHAWDTLMDLAQQARQAPSGNGELQTLVNWWAGNPLETPLETHMGAST